MNDKVIILGAGGSTYVIIDILSNQNIHNILLLDDDTEKIGGHFTKNIYVCGPTTDIINYDNTCNIIIGVGSTGNLDNRIRLYNYAKSLGKNIPPIACITSSISSSCELSSGDLIFPGVIINSFVDLGENVLINTGSIIEHNCEIGDNSFISPGCTICGNVKIGRNVFIGAGTTIIGGLTIGDNTIIGAGSVVVKNIRPNEKAFGNPARIILEGSF